MKIRAVNITNLPHTWDKYMEKWCSEVSKNPHVDAQVLIGNDLATLHPYDIINENGYRVETESARLKCSVISKKYLATGHQTQIPITTVEIAPITDVIDI